MSPKTKLLNKNFRPILLATHDNQSFKSLNDQKQHQVSDVIKIKYIKNEYNKNKMLTSDF